MTAQAAIEGHYENKVHSEEFYASEFDRHRFVSAPDFRRVFGSRNADLVELLRNPGSGGWKSLVSKLLLLPNSIPFLEKYCTTGMYWRMRKRGLRPATNDLA